MAVVDKLSKIKLIIFDVDGVLTDGSIIIDSNGNEIKNYNVKDGQLMPFFKKLGYQFCSISGRKSVALDTRMNELGINEYYSGIKEKLNVYEKIKNSKGLTDEHIMYIGDDINDVNILQIVGVAVTPNDSAIKSIVQCDIVTNAKGGKGVLREVFEIMVEELKMKTELIKFIKQLN